jgi:hypothetical protein
MANQAHADHLARWDTALAAGVANDTEPGTADILLQLGAAATGLKDCLVRRASLKFQQQQNSRDLDEFLAAGKEAFSRLALVVKGRYGRSAEKLAEWGIQPFRFVQKSKLELPLPEDARNEKAA